jgi:hypothetical protein
MDTLIIFLSSIAGISLTYFFKRKFEMNTVRASAISIIAGCCIQFLLSKAFPGQLILLKIPYAVCGASFCGMSSSKILKNWWWVLVCGSAYAWIFIESASTFEGMGGWLGTGACLSVLLCYGLMTLGEKAIYFSHKEL